MGELKNRSRFSTTIPTWQKRALKEFSERTRIDQSLYVEEALNDLFRKYNIDIEKEKNLPSE